MVKNLYRSFRLIGLLILLGVALIALQPQWRLATESNVFGWLHSLHMAAPDTSANTTADTLPTKQSTNLTLGSTSQSADTLPDALPFTALQQEQRHNLVAWLSKKYRVAQEPLQVIVAQAFETGRRLRLDPTLILAVMAVESGFNPFAKTPMSNLGKGTRTLYDYITMAGSVEHGLQLYAAEIRDNELSYTAKVLGEQQRLQAVVNKVTAAIVSKTWVAGLSPQTDVLATR